MTIVPSHVSGDEVPATAPPCRRRAWLSREPLLLFLLLGALLFAANQLFSSTTGDDDPHQIHVDRDALIRFLQYRSKVFDQANVSRSFDEMSAAERQQLIDSYVREEALYRQALAWGLDKQDYVVRRRLVQSLEFALGADSPDDALPSEDELRGFHAENPQLYAVSPTISFSHVFFRRGPDAEQRVADALGRIRADPVDAASLGDRFLYQAHYADRSRDVIARDFGSEFAAELFSHKSAPGWIGPIASDHGLHLVHAVRLKSGGIQPFEVVRDKVAVDAADTMTRAHQEAALQRIVGEYRANLSSDLQTSR